MAGQRSTSNNPPPAFTPPSYASVADSDDEADVSCPTPVHSPGGPQYDDLPPSYDEAQQQALDDERNGVPSLDANQLEAHRLTLNEGPNEPEVWEYRVRGEEPDTVNEHEQAPAYERHFDGPNINVPVQHVSSSENIPVGRVGNRRTGPPLVSDPTSALLNQALKFASHKPNSDVQYAPRLVRCIAIPQESLPAHAGENHDASSTSVQFLRAYAKPLHSHDVRPAEFVEFLDGLTAVCEASRVSSDDLVSGSSRLESSSSMVHNYIKRANSSFFAPRGLEVSLRSFSALLTMLSIPSERGQRAGAIASVLDDASTGIKRAQSLYPWIEALDDNVPAPSTRTLALREMTQRWEDQGLSHARPSHAVASSVAESSHRGSHSKRRRGRGSANAQNNRAPPLSGPAKLQKNGAADIDETESHEYVKKGKSKALDDYDDTSSISSDSSDSSDSDSDSDSDDHLDTQAAFLARIRSINAQAENLAAKGKKELDEIAQDRALAIEKAQNEKIEMDARVEEKMSKRALKREWRQRGRELKKQHRLRRREMRDTYEGKGKEKLKRSKQWREEKRTYREAKKEFRREKRNVWREWKDANYGKRTVKRGEVPFDALQEEVMNRMVWVVVENSKP